MYNFTFFQSKSLGCQTIIAGLAAIILLITGINVQAQQSQDYIEGQVIVKFKRDAQKNAILAMRENLNVSAIKKLRIIDAELWNLSGVTVEEALSRYQGDARIEYIEPDYKVYAVQTIQTLPNDPQFSSLWGLNNTGQFYGTMDADIDAPEAWNIQTGKDVLIGVIDSGIDWTHEDLADNIWVNPGEIPDNGIDDDGNGYIDDIRGWDFFNNDNNPMDDYCHGTHVSGTIAAIGNNGIGVTGVCWSAKLIPLKFMGGFGYGSFSNAILALEYAMVMGAKLTSNSYGGYQFSQAFYDAIKASGDAGILFIAAAGNDGENTDYFEHYPSNFDLDNIIAVAATNDDDELTGFSNYGSKSVDLGAPGLNILSTVPGNKYSAFKGTSMATPHVSGVAALIWSQFPNLTALQVKERILTSVDPVPDLLGKTVSGGRLNAFNALVSTEQDSIPPDAVTDLATTNPASNSITLTWTASGDDGNVGTAAYYDIRYSTFPIDAGNFDSATEVTGEPKPQEVGSLETFTVTGLAANTTYYFALKVFDEWGNGSPVSNSPSGITTIGVLETPDIGVTPISLTETLSPGATATQSLTITNEGTGILTFVISIEGAGATATSMSLNSPDYAWIKTNELNKKETDGTFRLSNNFSRKTGSNDTGLRDADWIFNILQANEQVANKANHSVVEAIGLQLDKAKSIMKAEEIWKSRQKNASSLTDPIYAVVLDGVGTYLANDRIWDELNANWSHYGDKEILIDYSTFHGIQITYDGLVASGADVLIISNNWKPTDPYGAFSISEAMAIAQYVDEGAGLYISGGTFNNGEYSELKYQIDYLAPLVGLTATEKYFWNGNTYGSLNFEVPGHPVLRDITEPYTSGWQDKTSIPLSGTWTSASLSTGILVGISTNRQTALVVQGNRVYHSGLPEHISGTESDKQFFYNAITLAGQQATWLTVNPTQGSILSGNIMDVLVTFDATGLNDGDYNANIMIASNDPDENPLIVPVTLSVSGQDNVPPAVVIDLATTNPASNSITLTWTASGDDGKVGTAAYYDIRYSTFPIDAGNFDSATEVLGEPKPKAAASLETFTVNGLAASTTYYFALKVFDEWGNGSPVSNSPWGTTSGGVQETPDIGVAPLSLTQTLSPGDTATQPLTITNEGTGTLTFDFSIEGAGAAAASMSLNSPDYSWMKINELNKKETDGTFRFNNNFSRKTGSNDTGLRNIDWILNILQANEQVATKANHSVIEAIGSQLTKPKSIMKAEEIWKLRQKNTSSLTNPIYAVVLDGVGTYLANDRIWDELNANWSNYGDKEILIDYSTFHGIQITYDGLVASGADVLIISNNWKPTDPYGAFSISEVMAIAQYVNEGAGLYISGGTLNNGEYPELKYQIDYLAPLVGLNANEKYFWNGNTYGSLNFEVPGHPVLRDITEPYASGWQDKTSIPSTGTWTSASLSTGTLVGISGNKQSALVVQGNRVYHSGLPEHISGTEADKQFLYNVITLAEKQTTWLTVNPTQGSLPPGSSMDILVTFDATGLNDGHYNANIMIASNDPDENPFKVPVILSVNNQAYNPSEVELLLGTSSHEIPKEFALNQNYPNPFNSETNIRIAIPDRQGENTMVKISIYEVLGKLVRELVNDELMPGEHEIKWDGRNQIGETVPSGVYFYTMTTGDFRATKKMIVIR
jgi:subtilisin family serine protease